MTLNEYTLSVNVLTKEYKDKLQLLLDEYVKDNAEFKIGDFISNVTGIIKVESISGVLFFDRPQIIYYGFRYKKVKGELLRTKDMNMSILSNHLKLLSHSPKLVQI